MGRHYEAEVIDPGTAPEIFFTKVLPPESRNGCTKTALVSERRAPDGTTELHVVAYAVTSDVLFQAALRTLESAMAHCPGECPRPVRMS